MIVIANAAAGALSGAETRERLEEELRNAGLDAQVILVHSGAEIAAAIKTHCTEDCDTVIAAGGDGTVSAVAGHLAGTETKLGIIPAGTLNHFAKDLQIPLDIADAVRVIQQGATMRVDVCEVNGHRFVNNSSIGLYPEIVRKREEARRHGYRKWTAFLVAIVLTLMRLRLIRVRMQLAGRLLRRHTPFVFVGNNMYEVSGARLGSRSRLDAGTLCLCVARKTGRFGLFRMAVRGFMGGLKDFRDIDLIAAPEVRIDTRRRFLNVALDGELVRLASPLQYVIRPGMLRVIVPAAAGNTL